MKTRHFQSVLICIFLLPFFLLFQNCGGKLETESEKTVSSPPSLNSHLFTPSCLNINAQPILKSNDLFSGSNWNDPHVLKVGNEYIMYASSGSFVGDVRIYRLVSSNLVNWTLSPTTPVFQKSAGPTAWDRLSVETPSVVFFNGKYYMFYTGYADQANVMDYKVGYATSFDGMNWTRETNPLLVPTNPSGAPNLQFNQYAVGEPGAVIFNNKIYLYFTAVGVDATLGTTFQTIGLIRASSEI